MDISFSLRDAVGGTGRSGSLGRRVLGRIVVRGGSVSQMIFRNIINEFVWKCSVLVRGYGSVMLNKRRRDLFT